ncbi:MAG: hypothetical protein LBG97_07600 [Coriobacteriales bacterium]|jgi:uncharacterized protein YaaQ|nr:hypothetical protein [Coriobacteriales bacterium]
MCTNGVNAGQLKASIEQIDEAVALTRRWTHRGFHLAESGGLVKTTAKLKEAQSLLDDVRALLEEACELAENEVASVSSDSVTVSLA